MVDVPLDPELPQELEELVSRVLEALKNRTRLLLLYALRLGPHTVSELWRIVEGPRSNTSHHLGVLRNRGLVAAERRGNTVVYSLCYPQVIDAIEILRGVIFDELWRRAALRVPARVVTRPGHRTDGIVTDAADAVTAAEQRLEIRGRRIPPDYRDV